MHQGCSSSWCSCVVCLLILPLRSYCRLVKNRQEIPLTLGFDSISFLGTIVIYVITMQRAGNSNTINYNGEPKQRGIPQAQTYQGQQEIYREP
jgi:hypothetical protein